jgi:aminomethyltransferase
MPLWYSSGIKQEHLAVINSAGIFDTSHMAVILVDGPGSFDLLQDCFSKDLNRCIGLKKTPISEGKCVYGVFMDNKAHVIDDALVYKVDKDLYMIVVNAGMGTAIALHLEKQKNQQDVKVSDLTDNVAKMDIQGPASAIILSNILKNSDAVFESMPYFSFKGFFDNISGLGHDVTLKDGTPLLLSRTGYTGEFGFEIFILPEHIENLWMLILKAGSDLDVLPCGLAARDSLRAGAVLPLSHQDIGRWPFINTPWPFALPYDDDNLTFTKECIGLNALREIKNPEFTQAFVGTNLRKVPAGAHTEVIDESDTVIGSVLTCATDMAIGWAGDKIYSINSPDKPDFFMPKGLSCGFIKVSKKLSPGTKLTLKEGKRQIKVIVTEDVRPDRSARKPMKKML